MATKITLNFSQTRTYGKMITQTLGVSGEFELSPTQTVLGSYGELEAIVNDLFAEFETSTLPKLQFDKGIDTGTVGTGIQVFDGVSIVYKRDGAKEGFSIRTKEGKFAKFGAGIYEAIDHYPIMKAAAIKHGEFVFRVPLKTHIDCSTKHPRVLKVEGAS